MALADILKEKRGPETQEDFGKRWGVSKQAVSSWERGESAPKESILDELGIERVVEYRPVFIETPRTIDEGYAND